MVRRGQLSWGCSMRSTEPAEAQATNKIKEGARRKANNMKSLTQWTASIYFIFAITLAMPTSGWPVEDAIIAVVNDELITLKDLKDYAQSTYVGLVAQGLSDTQIQEAMEDMETSGINKLIEDKLILSKANLIGIDVREGIIDERVNEVKEKYGSEQFLINALVKNGATITDLRNKIRDQFKTKFIVDHEVKSKIYVNPQEVTHYYEQNKSQFSIEDRVKLESIFIAYGSDKNAALMKAVEAFKGVVAKRDFNDLIENYSDMPSVGIIERGQLLSVIEETVFNLEMDEISHLVEVENGIYIFKLIGQISSQISKLEDVKDSIYNQLYKKKFKSEFTRWIEGLKEGAYIEIKE